MDCRVVLECEDTNPFHTGRRDRRAPVHITDMCDNETGDAANDFIRKDEV
jgi:hypothetical protein